MPCDRQRFGSVYKGGILYLKRFYFQRGIDIPMADRSGFTAAQPVQMINFRYGVRMTPL